MKHPLITAAITSYNAQETIEAALKSAVAQDWPNLEVVAVDDGSIDTSVKLIEAFIEARKEKVPPIRLVKMPCNGGAAAARNRLIEEAKGEFIAFFDDDDISHPSRIQKQYNRIIACEKASESDLVICHAAREQVFLGGQRRYEGTMGTNGPPFPSGKAVADRILLGRLSPNVVGSCAACSQMARKGVYECLGGFDPALQRSEDTDFNVRLARQGGVFVGLAESLVVQKMTAGTEKKLAANEAAYKTLFAKHRDYLEQRGWLDFCLKWQDVRLAWLQHACAAFLAQFAVLFFRHPVKAVQKLVWSLPALPSRRAYRQWQQNMTVER